MTLPGLAAAPSDRSAIPRTGYPVSLALAAPTLIRAYLVGAFLTRRDEDRLMRELDSAYRDPAA